MHVNGLYYATLSFKALAATQLAAFIRKPVWGPVPKPITAAMFWKTQEQLGPMDETEQRQMEGTENQLTWPEATCST